MYKSYIASIFLAWLSLCLVVPASGAGPEWKVKIKVGSSKTYGYCKAGANNNATDGLDLLWDVPALLDNLNDYASDPYVYVYFPHPEWNDPTDNYSQDIKATDLPKEWFFEVRSNISGPLSISWPDLEEELPEGLEANLVDLEGEGMQTVDMREAVSFSFTNVANQPRTFQLTVSEAEIEPLEPFALEYNLIKRYVRLFWDANQDPGATQYVIYRDTAGAGFEEIGRTSIGRNQYLDILSREIVRSKELTELTYMVVSIGADGAEIRASQEVSVMFYPRQYRIFRTR